MSGSSDPQATISGSSGARLTCTIASLREQVARCPGDLEAGLMLGSVLHTAGDYAGSTTVLRRVVNRHPGSTRAGLLLARSEVRAGQVAEALEVLERLQKGVPYNPQPWQVAAGLAIQVRDWPALGRISAGWTSAHPRSCEAWKALSQSHFEQSRFSEAMDSFAPVLELEPENAVNHVSAARLAMAAQQYGAARAHLETAETLLPESGDVLFGFARLYHLTGQLGEAEKYCRRAIHARPQYAPAYTELGQLREGALDKADIDVIERMTEEPGVHPEYRAMLGFTLGEALDRRGEHDRAFSAWEEANRINRMISEREGIEYEPGEHEAEPGLLNALFCDPPGMGASATSSVESQCPIFVVGMPRSGTTLVESILASHSDVHGAGELPALPRIHDELMAVARADGVAAARDVLQANCAVWRERYLAALPSVASTRHVVDKQPLNYRSVGLIRFLFPRSPIICTQRPAMDTGLSIFRHNFSKNWPCAHRLVDIGHYYGVYQQIVTLWRERYPGAMHVVDHEALVADPKREIRRLVEFVGLEFESACLTPHVTERTIDTFSSVQVRRPVSDAYSGRSAYYPRELSPLRDVLMSIGVPVCDGTDVAGKGGRR